MIHYSNNFFETFRKLKPLKRFLPNERNFGNRILSQTFENEQNPRFYSWNDILTLLRLEQSQMSFGNTSRFLCSRNMFAL